MERNIIEVNVGLIFVLLQNVFNYLDIYILRVYISKIDSRDDVIF